jgi:pimeloyl-ACP methyl ester carboxylesterase
VILRWRSVQSERLLTRSNTGAISTSYTSFRPNLVKRLILVGPAGLMQQQDVPAYTKIFNYPLLVKLWLSPVFRPLALKAFHTWSAGHKGTVSAESKQAEDFEQKVAAMATDQIDRHSGYVHTLINTAKDYPLIGLDVRYRKVGQSTTPVYALWGDADVVSVYCRFMLNR